MPLPLHRSRISRWAVFIVLLLAAGLARAGCVAGRGACPGHGLVARRCWRWCWRKKSTLFGWTAAYRSPLPS